MNDGDVDPLYVVQQVTLTVAQSQVDRYSRL